MRKKLVAGNWKMHGRLDSNRALLQGLRDAPDLRCEVSVCVPAPYLAQAQSILTGSAIAWGGQNCCEYAQGAYTGEIAAGMLADFGCRHVLVGHSERRSLYGESDSVVAAKFVAAQAAGLIPVLCVGESLVERESGQTFAVVARQISAVLDVAGVAAIGRAVLAYEPVWAIGTGRTATPGQAQEVHAAIRAQIAAADARIGSEVRILYGGSVKPQNAGELFAGADVDGGLIGGAALVLDDFLSICRSAG